MGNLNDVIGAIGGVILACELILLVLVLLVINAGLALGLAWVLRKMDWVHDKIAFALRLEEKLLDRGTRAAAMPVIVSTSVWRGLKAGVNRATHWPRVVRAPSSPAQPATPSDQSRTTAQPAA